jgi:hypothetical protein
MRLHVDEEQGLLEERDEEAGGDSIVVVLVLMHVGFLGEDERRVLKAYIIVAGSAAYPSRAGTGK